MRGRNGVQLRKMPISGRILGDVLGELYSGCDQQVAVRVPKQKLTC